MLKEIRQRISTKLCIQSCILQCGLSLILKVYYPPDDDIEASDDDPDCPNSVVKEN